jgi:hypothetical protein
MPRKRRAATASAENGTKSGDSGECRAAKKLKADGHEMGTVEDKEVSRFSYSASFSYLKNIESCSKLTSQIKDGKWLILRLRASTGI